MGKGLGESGFELCLGGCAGGEDYQDEDCEVFFHVFVLFVGLSEKISYVFECVFDYCLF